MLDADNRHERALKSILKRNRNWSCLHPCCTRRSIFSHAISESISLATIAEAGHLSTIISRRQKDIKTLQFGEISVHDATAFNGFCEVHDALFSVLDKQEIADAKSLLLQAYRSVISESANESRIASLRHTRFKDADIANILDTLALEHPVLQDEPGRAFVMTEYAKIAESEKRREIQLMQLPSQLLEKLAIIGEVPLDGFSVVSTELLSHHIPFRRLDFQIPVALNCILPLVAGDTQLDFYFTVIPYEQSTFVIGVVPKASEQWLLDRLMQSFSSDIAALDLVESIMSCNNEWYIAPSVLVEMPSEKREIFLHDSTFINEQRFYEHYDLTIFDSLRREIAQRRPEDEAELRIDMINVIPHRECYEIRNKRMIDALVSQPVKLREL